MATLVQMIRFRDKCCWHCDTECPVLNIDFVLGGYIKLIDILLIG